MILTITACSGVYVSLTEGHFKHPYNASTQEVSYSRQDSFAETFLKKASTNEYLVQEKNGEKILLIRLGDLQYFQSKLKTPEFFPGVYHDLLGVYDKEGNLLFLQIIGPSRQFNLWGHTIYAGFDTPKDIQQEVNKLARKMNIPGAGDFSVALINPHENPEPDAIIYKGKLWVWDPAVNDTGCSFKLNPGGIVNIIYDYNLGTKSRNILVIIPVEETIDEEFKKDYGKIDYIYAYARLSELLTLPAEYSPMAGNKWALIMLPAPRIFDDIIETCLYLTSFLKSQDDTLTKYMDWRQTIREIENENSKDYR